MKLRPHHGLCIQQFIGRGYSDTFVENMKQVIACLEKQPNQIVLIQAEEDDICKSCPYNQNGKCQSGQKVLQYDKKCLDLCKIKEGEISWKEWKERIFTNIIYKKLIEEVCVNCNWQKICIEFYEKKEET